MMKRQLWYLSLLLTACGHLSLAQWTGCGSGWCNEANGDCSNRLCYCNNGFYGENCTTACNPCPQGQVCNGSDTCGGCHPDCSVCGTVGSEPTCKCPDGFTGETCTERFCDSMPCQNGGFCNNLDDGFHCSCVQGWVGPTCSVRCTPECDDLQICFPIMPPDPPTEAVCECREGLSGNNCTSITCGAYNAPCLNAGECLNGTCICKNSFTGLICQKDCNPSCQANEKCVEDDDDIICKGTCDGSVVCQNGGTCTDDSVCLCPDGWFGDFCETKAPCDSADCLNGGTCTEDGTCHCTEEWHGDYCQNHVMCEDHVTCENGGTCTEDKQCMCADGWQGDTCQESGCIRMVTSPWLTLISLLVFLLNWI